MEDGMSRREGREREGKGKEGGEEMDIYGVWRVKGEECDLLLC
jgi:hypothetical protein